MVGFFQEKPQAEQNFWRTNQEDLEKKENSRWLARRL